jgi:RNA polymerase sigma factor (sigma-70 family)
MVSETSSHMPMSLNPAKQSAATIMLTHEQHLELCKRIETANIRIHELKSTPGEQSGVLHCWLKVANEARNQLIMANQMLVASIARRYSGLGLDSEDLMQEGTIGLMTAIEKFDYRRGYKLSTYATRWIQQAISRAVSKQSRTIRIPEGQLAALRKLKAVAERLSKVFGGEPSAEEIAWELDLPVSRVRSLLAMEQQTISMHTPVGNADGAAIIDFIADSSSVDPAENIDTSIRKAWLKEAQKTLTNRELKVLKMRFGLDHECEHTLEEIGFQFGICGERVRQILAGAVDKVSKFVSSKGQPKPMMSRMSAAAKPCGNAPVSVCGATASPSAGKVKKVGLVMRSVEANANHHVWNNNGVWFCNFKVKTATGESKRIRKSLHTNNVEEARIRRDDMIRSYSESFQTIAA